MITITMSTETARDFINKDQNAEQRIRQAVKDCLPIKNCSIHVDRHENTGVFSVADGESNNNAINYRDESTQPSICTAPKGQDWTCKYFPQNANRNKSCPNKRYGKYCPYPFENGGPPD